MQNSGAMQISKTIIFYCSFHLYIKKILLQNINWTTNHLLSYAICKKQKQNDNNSIQIDSFLWRCIRTAFTNPELTFTYAMYWSLCWRILMTVMVGDKNNIKKKIRKKGDCEELKPPCELLMGLFRIYLYV